MSKIPMVRPTLLLVVLGLLTGQAPLPALGAQGTEQFSQVEVAALDGYRLALAQPAVRDSTRVNVLRQLRIVPPVAFVDGYWVTPLEFSQLFEIPAIREAVDAALSRSPSRTEATALLDAPDRLKRVAAFAFVANRLRPQLELPYVGDFERIERSRAAELRVFVVPVKDVDWAVAERVPPYPRTATEVDLECYFFCGDPASWDFDADGLRNVVDVDDDDDGIPDAQDAYPYWPGGSSCSCGDADFVGFTETFSAGITTALLGAYESVKRLDKTSHALEVGTVAAGSAVMQLVFPTRPAASLARECPDSTDTAVRYVSTDPEACARLRFRCEPGEVPFSDACGCGCRTR